MRPAQFFPAPLFFSLFLICACSPTGDRRAESPYSEEGYTIRVDENSMTSLADYLIRAPGIYVRQGAYGTDVLLRGRRPLYVVDGSPLQGGYESANSLVTPQQIERIEVLNTLEATSKYGSLAGNGAIEIWQTRAQ